ncbi:MAG TPA: FUSC family protein [Solirubrobacteraceae bacterium]|nr:FUSC family protein [Solirubrobacteraceae bacterium]
MPERPDNGSSPEPGALSVAVRDALNFDRRAVSIQGGLLAAIPVAAVLALGTIAWSSVAGVTMGAGAMLVGIAWRIAGGRPPLALLATDATVMAMSTFVGCLTGSIPWLHFGLLGVWALAGGLLVALGNRGGVIGTQAMIAFVVFGRFSQPAAASLALAGLVLAGGFAQVIFQAVVCWPTPMRWQRTATANAYRALAGLARGSVDTSTLPVAQAFDQAQASLSSLTLFGDPALMTLRSLVNEGLRMRVQLSTIHALMSRLQGAEGDGGGPPDQGGARILELAASGLDLAARAIEGDRAAAAELPAHMARLSSDTAEHALEPDVSGLALSRRLAGLAGQLRAVGSLAVTAGEGSGIRDRRPHALTNKPLARLRTDLEVLRANASLQSPAGRHAVRLTVVVLIAEVISRHLPLSRSYWMVVAAATTLRPEFGATVTRGAERAGGTALGVGLAGAIAVALHPTGATTVVLVGVLAWAGYSVFPASFALGFAFITAVVVFLLNAISPDTLATAWARLVDTLVGGSLGLLAYALWPTWSYVSARQSLADLVEAERVYIKAILAVIANGARPEGQEIRLLSRRVRLARTTTEANVARSLTEPQTRRIDAEQSQGALAAARRLVLAAHVLRLDAQEERSRRPLPELEPLAADLDSLLGTVDATLRARPHAPAPRVALPDLRADFEELERTAPKDPDSVAVLVELDEIVDSANGLAALAGLEAVDDQPAARRS